MKITVSTSLPGWTVRAEHFKFPPDPGQVEHTVALAASPPARPGYWIPIGHVASIYPRYDSMDKFDTDDFFGYVRLALGGSRHVITIGRPPEPRSEADNQDGLTRAAQGVVDAWEVTQRRSAAGLI